MTAFRMVLALAWRNCVRNYRRSLAVILTVGVGAGALFTFNGFNTGIMNQYRANTIRSRFGHGQVNLAGYRGQVFEKPWEHWIENPETVIAKMRDIPGVTHVFPRLEFYALLTNGSTTLSGRGQGIDGAAEASFFTALNIEQGQMLTGQPDGVMLGQGLARSLRLKVGDRVTVLGNTIYGSINGVDLTVVGIFHTGAKEFDDRVFRLPLAHAQKLLDTPKVESIAVGLRSIEDWEPFAKAVAPEGSGLEAVPFAVLDKVYYQNAVDWLGSQFRVIRLVILFIVVLGIFNTVSTGVLERKREVGNLRANGEATRDVMALFLAEGALLGVGGALFGIAFAYLANVTIMSKGILMPPSPGLTRQYHVLIELQAWNAFEVFLLGSLCALIGTFLAAYKVSRMPIGEALRST
jgi:putative ABC transport system permease protein